MTKKKKKDNPEETLLGIDYGTTNIGIALGRNGYVTPLKVLSGKNTMTAIHELTKVALENKIEKFIVGLPVMENGKETKQSLETRKFVKLLKVISKKPVEFVSEFDSSNESPSHIATFGAGRTRNNLMDHIAAALILKRYFDNK